MDANPQDIPPEHKAQLFDLVRATWIGLGVNQNCFHDGGVSAVLLLPNAFGAAETQVHVLRALIRQALTQADQLDAEDRGLRQPVPADQAEAFLIGPDDEHPIADALLRVGLSPVVFRDPTAILFFPAQTAITGSSLRAFARLAEEQARSIEAVYGPVAVERRAQATPPPGPRREPVLSGGYAQPSPMPARYAEPAPAQAVMEMEDAPAGSAPQPPPALPPAAERRGGQGARRGPLSMGVPGMGGQPAQVPDPIPADQRASSKKRP